jgi:hypothetical protein
VHVEQGQVDRLLAKNVEGFLTRGSKPRPITFRLDQLPQRLAVIAVVVGDQEVMPRLLGTAAKRTDGGIRRQRSPLPSGVFDLRVANAVPPGERAVNACSKPLPLHNMRGASNANCAHACLARKLPMLAWPANLTEV